MDTQTAVNWHMHGTVLIGCNCDYGCPCNFNARPTTGDCEGAWTWHIDAGQFGETRLDGLNVSVAGDWPAAIHEGNGAALILIDERADEAQREALATLLGGKAGGPWAILVTTFTEIHGPRYVPYLVELNGDRTTVRAGESLELAMEPIRNPVSGKEVHPGAVLPEGFIFKEGSFASSTAYRVRDKISFEHPGKYAAFAPFAYQG
ncbi:MAG: DUF1326 domain-containing protein [Thermomicrobiales bacterium]